MSNNSVSASSQTSTSTLTAAGLPSRRPTAPPSSPSSLLGQAQKATGSSAATLRSDFSPKTSTQPTSYGAIAASASITLLSKLSSEAPSPVFTTSTATPSNSSAPTRSLVRSNASANTPLNASSLSAAPLRNSKSP